MKQPLKTVLQILTSVYGSIMFLILWSNLPKWVNKPEIAKDFWYKAINFTFLASLFILPFFIAIKHAWKPLKKTWQLTHKNKSRFANARKAEATILEIGESELGTTTINDQPYVRLKLEIHDAGRKPYIITTDSIVPRLSVPSFQPGYKIPILIDPENPENVLINFD
jgi:hypothetical protein